MATMKLVHDVQVDKDTVITTTLTVDRGWLRMDHVNEGAYVGGSSLRLSHVVRVEKNQQVVDSVPYFWITLVDRDGNKSTLPFALTGDEVGQLDDMLAS
jgi:hypothetical protein